MAAECFSRVYPITNCGVYLSYGMIGGIGLGLSYIVPVALLLKWFPDRRGVGIGFNHQTRTFAVMFAAQVALFWTYPRISSAAVLTVATFAVLMCYGGGFGTMPAFAADHLGSQNIGPIYGLMLTAWGFASAFGPLLIALVRQANGAYRGALHVMAGVMAASVVLPLIVSPPRRIEEALGRLNLAGSRRRRYSTKGQPIRGCARSSNVTPFALAVARGCGRRRPSIATRSAGLRVERCGCLCRHHRYLYLIGVSLRLAAWDQRMLLRRQIRLTAGGDFPRFRIARPPLVI